MTNSEELLQLLNFQLGKQILPASDSRPLLMALVINFQLSTLFRFAVLMFR
jgi:hypothetical protein